MSYDVLTTAIRGRASHRKFTADPVPDEDVRRIVESGINAPSGHNRQPWRYIAIRDRTLLDRMAETALARQRAEYDRLSPEVVKELSNFEFYLQHFRNAPLVLAVLVTRATDPLVELYQERDPAFTRAEHYDTELLGVGASIQNCLLAAHSLGYGSCWLTAPIYVAQKDLEQLLKVPDGFNLVSLIAIGRPTKERRPAPKKALEELVEFRSEDDGALRR